jgi:hypothetical protein
MIKPPTLDFDTKKAETPVLGILGLLAVAD